MLYGTLEAGGTKMVTGLINEKGEVLERASFPTETPEKTMPVLIDWFKERKPDALGIGTFGPADLDETSPTYGYITSTPKLDWRDYNLLGAFKEALGIPIGFDTDVNAAALGEATFGCMKGLSDGIYITIGTGVGVGVLTNGKLLHGMLHPEAGHILLRQNPIDRFEGNCPYHRNCFEGLAAGPAIEKRYGKSAKELKDIPEVWELEAEYISQALVNYIMILSPKKIVLGGGVMHQEQLFPLVRKKTLDLLNRYINTKEIADIDNYIVPASLNDNQGILGCARLAELALNAR
ncbi:MAG: ROK family protein [Lachnospiraceae bacterium]|nr:ROK family protein [Lachnospiraceae bacterium]